MAKRSCRAAIIPVTPQYNLLSWRVLVVEDDPLMQLGIRQLLNEYSELSIIEIVANGYLGIEAALRHRPDLILMDIGLPGVDGIAATQRIKAELPQTKIVMLTSHTNETEVLAALAGGADAYCVKGRSIDALITAISAVAHEGLYLDAKVAQIIVQNCQTIQSHQSRTNTAAISTLSDREKDVLNLLVEGLSNPEIAKRLYISPHTVRGHMRSLMKKLTANDRVQVAVKALRAGLV